MLTHPRYFVAVFGDPQPPHKDVVESGVYHPSSKYAPFPVKPGDVMLLYCTAGYSQFPTEVPGIGIVLHADNQCVNYRWLPFEKPVTKGVIDKGFEPDDAKNFSLIRFDHFWLFDISQRSFARTAGAQMIAWENI